ncbi:MAG TPA: VOC family protein [Abditibacteriaceae bacterium]|jgi:PhnB protein
MKVQTYLFFDGRCEEATKFYCDNLGAQVTSVMRFNEMPATENGVVPPGAEDKIMHMSLRIGDTELMASDGRNTGQPKFDGFALTVTVADDAEAERVFAILADGGQIHMPMTPTFFASRFGMVADRFGVTWTVIAEA